MRVLAFDTSTDWCSVAALDGERAAAREEPVGNAQSERILPLALAALTEIGATLADIELIGFGAGPGSFTGVRIAASVGQGLALALDRPVIAVCTLQAIAQQARREHGVGRVIACTDARMGEIYLAAYEWRDETWDEIVPPAVLAPDAAEFPAGGSWVGCGSGFAAYPELRSRASPGHVIADLRATGGAVADIARARWLAGDIGDPAHALPIYVRHRVALTTAEREAGVRL